MRRRRFYMGMIAWLTVLALTGAAAAETPEVVAAALTSGDADVLVTDARGVIVGVGRVVAGASFELRILEGFVGPARLTLLRADGTTEALEVVVDGRVLVAGFDLLELLAERVEAFAVEVGGVGYGEAEKRDTDAGAAAGDGPRPGPVVPPAPVEPPAPGKPPAPVEPPGPPEAPGVPPSPGPRGPQGRP